MFSDHLLCCVWLSFHVWLGCACPEVRNMRKRITLHERYYLLSIIITYKKSLCVSVCMCVWFFCREWCASWVCKLYVCNVFLTSSSFFNTWCNMPFFVGLFLFQFSFQFFTFLCLHFYTLLLSFLSSTPFSWPPCLSFSSCIFPCLYVCVCLGHSNY